MLTKEKHWRILMEIINTSKDPLGASSVRFRGFPRCYNFQSLQLPGKAPNADGKAEKNFQQRGRH